MQAINTYWRRQVIALFLTPGLMGATGCAAFASYARDSGREFLATVDVARVMDCRRAGDARSVAMCLGAATVRPGLMALVDSLADRLEGLAQATSGGGAQDDVTAAEIREQKRLAKREVEALRAMGCDI